MDEFRKREIERGTRGERRSVIWTERTYWDTEDKAMGIIILNVGGRVYWVLIERPIESRRLTFPGGDVERGETRIQAVVRETREETGIDLSKEALAAVLLGTFPMGGERRGDIYVYRFVKTLPDIKGLHSSPEGTLTLLDAGQLMNAFTNRRLTENAAGAMRLLLDYINKQTTISPR